MRPCRRGTPGDADATRDTDLLDTCWQDAAAGQFGESATTHSCGIRHFPRTPFFYRHRKLHVTRGRSAADSGPQCHSPWSLFPSSAYSARGTALDLLKRTRNGRSSTNLGICCCFPEVQSDPEPGVLWCLLVSVRYADHDCGKSLAGHWNFRVQPGNSYFAARFYPDL